MKKILVVEDSSTVLTMLKKEFAKHENIEVFYAQSYEDAAKIVNNGDDNTENHGDEDIENVLSS